MNLFEVVKKNIIGVACHIYLMIQ